MKKAQGCRRKAVGRGGRIVSGLAVIGVAAAFAVVSPSVAHGGDAQQALVWLEGQQRSDGSWCEADDPTPPQGGYVATGRTCVGYTAEVLQAVASGQSPVASVQAAVAKGVVFMENVVSHDTGTLARKLVVGKLAGYVRSEDVEALRMLVTTEGGFGAWRSYTATAAYRTIPGLQFFAGYDTTLAARAALYLASTPGSRTKSLAEGDGDDPSQARHGCAA